MFPDLGARAVLAKAQRPNVCDHVHAIRRALDLPCFRTCRAKHRSVTRALGRRAAIAEVGDVLDTVERLDPLGPHGMAVDQGGPTPRATGQLGPISNVRTDAKSARRFHRGPLSTDLTEPPPRLPAHSFTPAAGSAGTVFLACNTRAAFNIRVSTS